MQTHRFGARFTLGRAIAVIPRGAPPRQRGRPRIVGTALLVVATTLTLLSVPAALAEEELATAPGSDISASDPALTQPATPAFEVADPQPELDPAAGSINDVAPEVVPEVVPEVAPEIAPQVLPAPVDADGDGLTDDEEGAYGTNPLATDTDSDGVSDRDEIWAGTDPLAPNVTDPPAGGELTLEAVAGPFSPDQDASLTWTSPAAVDEGDGARNAAGTDLAIHLGSREEPDGALDLEAAVTEAPPSRVTIQTDTAGSVADNETTADETILELAGERDPAPPPDPDAAEAAGAGTDVDDLADGLGEPADARDSEAAQEPQSRVRILTRTAGSPPGPEPDGTGADTDGDGRGALALTDGEIRPAAERSSMILDLDSDAAPVAPSDQAAVRAPVPATTQDHGTSTLDGARGRGTLDGVRGDWFSNDVSDQTFELPCAYCDNDLIDQTFEWPCTYCDVRPDASRHASIDSDGDGLLDRDEERYGADPGNPDTDGDGIRDGKEIYVYGTFPFSWDTDGDGLGDYQEVMEALTNPRASDSDGDTWNDGVEVLLHGTDPNDRNSHPSQGLKRVPGT